MMLKQALSEAKGAFIRGNIDDAWLEAELLLRHTLNINRVQLYQRLDRRLTPNEAADFRGLVERRLSGEPTAYITEHREFYGRDFYVNPSVLIPRPETELLVEKALEYTQRYSVATIADIGTGSGAIAISLALALPWVKMYATDISAAALEVAWINCQRYGVDGRIDRLVGDMVDALPESVDLILANLPYVTPRELSRTRLADFEPRLALDGGSNGLERITQLCHQVGGRLSPGGALLLEIGQKQAQAVTSLLSGLYPAARIEVTPDLAGIDRLVSLIWPAAG
ncbi:MAG: peptide chain release factor N(5)-glutamine methyltransferase [Dehalococcoidales bacterium]|nr:peptide chain release factor N(5)-glutamine methyltransferase [Dehalococcoidales bacterium]